MSVLNILLLTATIIAIVQCDVIRIVPSATSNCPGELSGEVCLNLQQFIINPSPASEVVLLLSPGEHILPANLAISTSTRNFSLIAEEGTATISCAQSPADLTMSGVRYVNIVGVSLKRCANIIINGPTTSTTSLIQIGATVNITGLSFKQSGDIRISAVATVLISNTLIVGSQGLIIKALNVELNHVSITDNQPVTYTLHVDLPVWNTKPRLGTSVLLHDVTLRNNSQNSLIYHIYTVILEYVNFINSGALLAQGRSGLISPQTIFNMTHSVISHNVRGLSLFMDKGYIGNTTITSNIGGIHTSYTNLTVENSVISNNSYSYKYEGGGGIGPLIAAYSINVTVLNCKFNGNAATALVVLGGNLLNIEDSMFAGNYIDSSKTFEYDPMHYRNGASVVFSGSEMTVSNSIFNSNTAPDSGGAIYAVPYTSVITYNNTFFNNSAASGGAVSFDYTESSILYAHNVVYQSIDDVFIDNSASNSGGAIYSNITSSIGEVRVKNALFHGNDAKTKRGGAIFSSAGLNVAFVVENSTFDSNSAPSCGAIVVSDHVTVEFNSSSFTNNTATGQTIGGGVGCIRNASVSIENSTFTYNTANLHGGVMVVDNSSMFISDSTFLGNSAASNGGVFHTRASSSDYLISHSVFSQNSVHASGGVMYVNREGSLVTASQSIFSFNRAEGRGGVISLITGSLHISTSNIYNNTADVGSDVSACSSDAVEVQGLNSSMDTSQPMTLCILYEGSVDTFDIELPHDLNTLVTTTPPVTSHPPTTSPVTIHTDQHHQTTAAPSENFSTPSGPQYTSTSSYPTTQASSTTDNGRPMASLPSSRSSSTSLPSPSNQELQAKNKYLVVLVCVFAVVIVFMLMVIIALVTKVIYDWRRKEHKHPYNTLGTFDRAGDTTAIRHGPSDNGSETSI